MGFVMYPPTHRRRNTHTHTHYYFYNLPAHLRLSLIFGFDPVGVSNLYSESIKLKILYNYMLLSTFCIH